MIYSAFTRPLVALALGSITLAGCTAAVQEAAPQQAANIAPPALTDPLYTDIDNPTTPADLSQTASILEVERYRPNYQLTSCPSIPGPSFRSGDELGKALQDAQAYSEAKNGLGLLVLKGGRKIHLSAAEGVNVTTPFASASMMKSVIALLYGIAIDDGVIASADDRVGDYLPEWSEDARGDITLRQLLTMSAGLGQSDFLKILLSPDIGSVALELEKTGEADTEFAYNNAITKVLTIVLDRQLVKAGKGGVLPYLQSELWCPLGNGDAQVWVDTTGQARGYAGLHAGMLDYANIGELIRNKGAVNGRQIVPADWIAQMATPSKANPQYGLQVWLGTEHTAQRAYSATNPIKVPHSEPFDAKDIIYFDGFGGQRVYVIPSKELVIVRFGEVNLTYDDAVIPNLLTRAAE
ncbi:MAG: serine hydrolase [Pseudomonadota bacterium]